MNSGSVFEVFLSFLKLGVTSFGGPIAHIGYFQKAFVTQKRWLNDSQFSQLLAISQFLPGPASSQLGFAIGLLRAGWLGALAAFIAFTLPSALLLIVFAALLPQLSGSIAEAALHGLKLVACAVVADAVLGMSRKLCPDKTRQTMAVITAVCSLLTASALAQLLVVVAAGFAGWLLCKNTLKTDQIQLEVGYGKNLGVFFLLVFLGLMTVLWLLASSEPTWISVADGFYRAGAMVFGGGHVVLPLLEESVVETGWVTAEDFLAGYGAAQAIPGPMFAISAYLGYLLPSQNPAWLMAAIALVFMFLPGLLLIAAVLPVWQSLSRYSWAASVIAGVNAAVVGLLAAALYDPIFTSAIRSSSDFAIALVGFALLAIGRLSPVWVVLWCVGASALAVTVL